MPRLWERLAGRQVEARDGALSLNDWAQYFTYGGLAYPIMPRTTMGQLNEERIPATGDLAYRMSSPVFSLVLARMQVFSQIHFQWTQFKAGQPGDLFGSPELSLLERPWPGGTTADLLAKMEVDVSVAGNSYIRRGNKMLHRLDPLWVSILLGSNEETEHPAEAADTTVLGYVYRPPSARMRLFLPEEVAHYAPIPDPAAQFLGMSWLTPVLRDVQADTAMSEHKLSFLMNAATPNLAVKFDPSVTLEQIKEFKELMEEEHRGVANAWKTLFLGGGADTTVIGKDFKELEFAATQGKGESRLAAAAGVPPSWVGFSEGLQGSALNAGNFSTARRRFSDGTMAHLWGNACSSLQQILRPPNSSASLWYTTAAVPFMREDAGDQADIQQKQSTTITTLVKEGFTAESAVAAVQNNDWTLLKHTGLVSVQLQKPGAGDANTPDGEGDA